MNRRLSRHLRQRPGPTRGSGLLLAGLAAALVTGAAWLLLREPAILALICVSGGVLAGWARHDALRRARVLRALAAERAGESICTFARSFERRGVDPWVIRAVHEELAFCYRLGDRLAVPIRAADLLTELGMDGDDLDDAVGDVAWRTGYSLRVTRNNPLYGRVRTVGDLVRFFNHQPRERAA
jgi:hypothetical protein